MPLSPDALERHKRHLLLKEIGGPGVQKLKQASVTIIGAGALGGPCALYLAAAGVGRLTLVDDDLVDLSNLQRQVQFDTGDIGQPKAERLAARLIAIDPELSIHGDVRRFEDGQTLAGDILVDATDNYPARFALNSEAHRSRRPLVSGAAQGWQGQVAVFASGSVAGAPCYQCFIPEPPPDAANCETEGVVGAVTGIIGTRMALEALKLITGAGDTLIGRVFILDGLSGRSRSVTLSPDPDCRVCGTASFL